MHKVAVVTGTGRLHGIGRSIAREFINQGYLVLGVDCNHPEPPLPPHGLCVHHICNISNPEEVPAVHEACVKSFGVSHINVLVNNAAVVDPHLPDDAAARIAEWHRVIAVNLTGAFLMSQVCIPHMPGGSTIIHISSTRALQSEPNSEAYAASKAGLLGLTHAQATTLADKNIRVNAVLPGWIDTTEGKDLRPEDHAWHAAGRVGRPEDVAQMCWFLTQADFVTGQHFVVDGGVSKKMVYPE